MLSNKVKLGEIQISESVNATKKKQLAKTEYIRPKSQESIMKTKFTRTRIRDLIKSIENIGRIDTVYDEVQEEIADKYNEQDLTKTNFY